MTDHHPHSFTTLRPAFSQPRNSPSLSVTVYLTFPTTTEVLFPASRGEEPPTGSSRRNPYRECTLALILVACLNVRMIVWIIITHLIFLFLPRRARGKNSQNRKVTDFYPIRRSSRKSKTELKVKWDHSSVSTRLCSLNRRSVCSSFSVTTFSVFFLFPVWTKKAHRRPHLERNRRRNGGTDFSLSSCVWYLTAVSWSHITCSHDTLL